MKIHALWLSASVLTLGWCGAAAAQTAPEAESADDSEIVITAERRSVSLQRAPISASVLTGEDLENRGVSVVDQLQFVVPAATVNNFGQGIDFNIRGIGKAEHNTQTTTGVITYRDGVATFPGYFTSEPYYDIARVEVLRGPQGTFVGQNATGGAVFVNSRDPVIGGGYHGYVMGSAGNYNYFGLQGALNVPMSDTLAARVAFDVGNRDSFYDITGPYTGDDGVESRNLRIGVLWEPSDNLSVLFKTDLAYLDLSAYPADPVNGTNDPFEITANAEMMALDRGMRSSLRVDYEFANGITLRSVSGYQEATTIYRTDLDGTSAGNNTFRDLVDEVIYSQEFNLISPSDRPITWILGAYYQYDRYDFPTGEFVIGVPPGSVFSEYVLQGENPKETSAVFGQLTFDLPRNFELQVGARYSDSRTTNHITVSQYGLPLVQDQSASWSNLSGKVALNWTIDDHNFVYGFVATGFRPGGLNVPIGLGIPAPFDEELVTSYEAGWKRGWLNGHVRTQLSAFYNSYENFQVIVSDPSLPIPFVTLQINAPDTTQMYGLEFQVEAMLGNWSIDAGLGWLHSELGTFYATDPRIGGPAVVCDPLTGPASATCLNLEGREQTYAPELTFNLGVQYRWDLPGGDTLTPRLNYGHVSQQWATLFQNTARGDDIEARNIFNAQLAWTHGDFTATLYGTNITDETYVGAINSGLRFVGPPRQYGIRLVKTF
ncbi:MAG: TonB-dependent receptor [Hyphomonadaceae bacterium]